jgi:hypothetical protein
MPPGRHRGRTRAGLAALVLAVSALSGTGTAAKVGTDPAPDACAAGAVRETPSEPTPSLPERILAPYDGLRERARERLGLDYEVAYSLLFQQGSGGVREGRSLVGQLHVQALWSPLHPPRFGSGSLGLYFVDLREFLGTSATEFSESLDSSFLVNDSDVDGAFTSLQELWWQQRLLAGRVGLVVGQLDLPSLMNANTYADDDTISFVAQPVSTNPVSAIPAPGLGAYLELVPSDLAYLSFAFVDANANGRYPDFETFARGEYVYAGELGLTPSFEGVGAGTYRFSGYYADETADEPAGSGFALSFEQELGDAWGLFLRYQVAFENEPALKQSLGVGAVATRPFGRAGDWLGLALIWAEPSDDTRRDEFGVEAYWRIQLGERLELTPDLQIHAHPGRDEAVSFVGGLRLRLVL